MTRIKIASAVAAGALGMGVIVAACGTSALPAPTSAHVSVAAAPAAPAAPTVPTGTSAVPTTTTGSNPTTVGTAPAPAPAPVPISSPMPSTSLDQVAAQLGALDQSLGTVNSDLSNPQGDS